jgi:hypothetical protein
MELGKQEVAENIRCPERDRNHDTPECILPEPSCSEPYCAVGT